MRGARSAAAEAIRDNTRVIWELQTTNEVAERSARHRLRAIEAKAAAVVEALESHAAAGGRRWSA